MKISPKYIKLFLPISFCFFTASAQTNVSGGIYANTTWTAANSPYIVTGDVVLFTDYVLTIEPGVEVRFNNGKELECRGKLVANGNVNDSIIFTSNDPAPIQGIWRGLTFTYTGSANPVWIDNQANMSFCRISYAYTALDLAYAYAGPYDFSNCAFSYNRTVNDDGGKPYTNFTHCLFRKNYTGLNYTTLWPGYVSYSAFVDNFNATYFFDHIDHCTFTGSLNQAISAHGSATDNIADGNNIGARCTFNSANPTFLRNKLINNNVGIEILSFFNGSTDFQDNEICHNTLYNVRLLHHNDADLGPTCFCLPDSQSIRASIFDGYNNTNYGLVSFDVVSCSTTLAVQEPSLKSSTFYPNPVGASSATLDYAPAKPGTSMMIFDMNGRVRNTITDKFGQGSLQIDLQNWTSGIYQYVLLNGKEVLQTGRFTVQ